MKNQLTGKLLNNANLAKYTSWRVGGPAKQLYFPADKDDLLHFLSTLPAQEPIVWMGLGSNLLIRDGGINATVINTRSSLKGMQVTEDGLIKIEAGVFCAQAARFCSRMGYTGAEFLAGIPGTIGGALHMNAGAFGSEMWDKVEAVEMISTQGQLHIRKPDEFHIKYRSVKSREDEWFLVAHLRLDKGNSTNSDAMIRQLLEQRAQSQPIKQLTCGSVFKNPEGNFAAYLIEQSGLKGFSIGAAQVSEKHANFIVNTGNASAEEIESLIKHVQHVVHEKQGIDLQTEVCIVGDKAA